MEDGAASDLALVERALRGEAAAFGDLVARFQRLVASVAWRYGVPRDDVEDVVSEVFVKVYENLRRFRPDHPFATWLYRLAVNHVIDRGRRHAREHRRVDMPAGLADPTPDPAVRAESSQDAHRVRQALAGLPAHYRDALFLVYVEGLRLDEVSRWLGVPLGTVKTRLMRGRHALRRALEAGAAPERAR
jgi:RNA polymerase sigma-70 factor (ECF subfamily)